MRMTESRDEFYEKVLDVLEKNKLNFNRNQPFVRD